MRENERHELLRLAIDERNAWRIPGSPRVGLREAFNLAKARLAKISAHGGVGCYSRRPFGMFLEGAARRAAEARRKPLWFDENEADSMFRNIAEASARVVGFRRSSVYQAGEDRGGFAPVVARVGTARRDANSGEAFGLWIAGARETESDGILFDVAELYAGECDTPPDDAERAAHSLAANRAEEVAEWDSAYSEGRNVADALEEARGELCDALADARKLKARAASWARFARMAESLMRDESRNAAELQDVAWEMEREATRLRAERAELLRKAREDWRDARKKAEHDSPVPLSRLRRIARGEWKSGNETRAFACGFCDAFNGIVA